MFQNCIRAKQCRLLLIRNYIHMIAFKTSMQVVSDRCSCRTWVMQAISIYKGMQRTLLCANATQETNDEYKDWMQAELLLMAIICVFAYYVWDVWLCTSLPVPVPVLHLTTHYRAPYTGNCHCMPAMYMTCYSQSR
jgi:hypothetical protein